MYYNTFGGNVCKIISQGCDELMYLKHFYSEVSDNCIVRVTRILENFESPTDALMISSEVFVIKYMGSGSGDIRKITLPAGQPRYVEAEP